MRKALFLVPIVLSLVVLGAHFLRFGSYIGVFAALLLIALLFLRKPWVARLMQVALVLGALEWLRTAYELGHMRALQGEPYGRMLVILGVVASVALCSALLFQTKTLKDMYGQGRGGW